MTVVLPLIYPRTSYVDYDGMSPVENTRFNALMQAIDNFQVADKKVVDIFRIFPTTGLRKPEYIETLNMHINASEALVASLSAWAEQARTVGYYPTEGEQTAILDIIEKAKYEYRFFSIYYSKFRFETDMAGTYLEAAECIYQGNKAIDRIETLIQCMDEEI